MTRQLILVVVMVAACKKEHSIAPLQATATVTGPVIVITTTCTNFKSIFAENVAAECEGGRARLELPAANLGSGPRTIHVIASDENGMTLAATDLTVDVSLAGQPPYFRVAGCERDPASQRPTMLSAKVGDRRQDCATFGGARVKLQIESNPNAKLTIEGKTVAIPASGTLAHVVELVDPVLALKLEQVASGPKEPTAIPLLVPYSLESNGKTLAGNVELTEAAGHVGGIAREHLQLVGEGKAERGTFNPAKPGERRTVGWIGPNGKLTLTDRSGTVRDLDVIAVERETGRAENGTCDYEADGKQITAKRVLIDIELVATNLADGSVEKHAFPSSTASQNCPSLAVMDREDPKAETRVPDELVKRWLDTVAEPR